MGVIERSVTDNCDCGHQIIAHSATDGCVYCDCDKRWRAVEVWAAEDAVAPRNPRGAVDLLREVDDGWDRMMEDDDLDGMVEVVAKVRAFLATQRGQYDAPAASDDSQLTEEDR